MIAADTYAKPFLPVANLRVAPFAFRPDIPAPPAGEPTAVLRGHWLSAALDELDYGVVLLQSDMTVLHLNDAAQAQLDEWHPLQLCGRELRPRLARDLAPLHDAITSAASRGMRKLVTLGKDDDRTSVSVVPLEGPDAGSRAVLIVLGKRAVCESLSVQGYARSYGLTGAETRVLLALCGGTSPAKIADELGVAVSTVRSQIGSLRQKTGSSSIRALVRQIAVLPPVKGVLRKERPASSPVLRAV